MKIVHFDKKEGELKVAADTIEDLWHLSKVLKEGDEVESRTFRTYKVGTKEEKKSVRIRINAEEVKFSESANRLRVLGKIIWGSPEEYVQLGRHHTIEVGPGDIVKIKKKWMKHEVDRLRSAEKETKRPRLSMVVMDDDHALFAYLKPYGIEYGTTVRNPGRKRDDDYEKKEKEYFGQILSNLERMKGKIVVAGPGFTKDNFKNFIKQKNPELAKTITFDACSYAEPSGINELIKRGVIEKAVGEARFEKEEKEVERFFTEIYKETGKAVYGLEEVKKAVEISAASKLLILDSLLRTSEDAEKLVESAEKSGAEIIVISEEGNPGLKLKSFGGVGAVLRWKIE